MYLWARQWGIQPTEFWEMTIGEWWLEYDLKATDAKDKYAGTLTRGEVDELKELL